MQPNFQLFSVVDIIAAHNKKCLLNLRRRISKSGQYGLGRVPLSPFLLFFSISCNNLSISLLYITSVSFSETANVTNKSDFVTLYMFVSVFMICKSCAL